LWTPLARFADLNNSMGAQMALLLAAMDTRVLSVAAMVPPHVDRKVAVVAPSTIASRLKDVEVWLLTGEDDEYASRSPQRDHSSHGLGADARPLRLLRRGTPAL
jgi:hypothetical protein